jgi:hypothetical protein
MQIIEIVVAPSGETKVQTKGFTGSSCRQASEFLEQALGRRVREDLTSEFYATQAAPQSQQLGGTEGSVS